MQLKDKVALVTGSSKGAGKAIAIAFANEGAKVIINYNHSQKEAKEVVKIIEELGGEATAIKADVSKTSEIKSLFKKAIQHFKKIDILVNNAGAYTRKLFHDVDDSLWDNEIATNLKSVFFCSQEFSNNLKGEKGNIINISSAAGIMPKNNMGVVYALTKAGIIYLTKSLALTLAPNIRVNSIAPGYIRTDMFVAKDNPQKEKEIDEKLPLHRINEPEDIAKSAVFLASEQSANITGHILVIDSGQTLT
jgi:3-oxoacyl-[acyl-carrier protein] reductase